MLCQYRNMMFDTEQTRFITDKHNNPHVQPDLYTQHWFVYLE